MCDEAKVDKTKTANGRGLCGSINLGRGIGAGGPFLGSPPLQMENKDFIDKAILVGDGSDATRCEALISVHGTSIETRLDINFHETVTLGGKYLKNGVDLNKMFTLCLEFNQAYFKALDMVNENHRKMKAYQAKCEADMKKTCSKVDLIASLMNDMEPSELKVIITKMQQSVDEEEEEAVEARQLSLYDAFLLRGHPGHGNTFHRLQDAISHLKGGKPVEAGDERDQLSKELSSNPVFMIQDEASMNTCEES